MRRLQIILSSMLETGVKAVFEGRTNLAEEVLHMEEEADRIYWMIIRQLLLAVTDRRGRQEARTEDAKQHCGKQANRGKLEAQRGRAGARGTRARRREESGK